MKRNRVLSFMSDLGKKGNTEQREPRPMDQAQPSPKSNAGVTNREVASTGVKESPTQRQRSNTAGRERSNSRPGSMIGGYIPPVMDISPDTIPELFPIFTLLNSHSNKLYQEGYFLKLNDLDVHGKPYSDRSWTECFAQLVGTVLSLWDAAALDAAGEEGEVAPSFINLADASIRMMNTLQTGGSNQPLQNVLSISTAGKNRYLLHFSSYHILTQWTAAIRLAMFENACLQEAYTGSLIAGKGKGLNNIKQIMTKTIFQTEEWTRVRFGAGTPWRRCWCVIAPPDPKVIKQHTKAAKKNSAYSRSSPMIKGDIKFYDTSKVTKKTKPVATINDAYSTYAVYPQSRALIDQSTLIKIEGTITIHSSPEITTEGFVFVMPEVHPAVSGFEMMLRFLFPIYDIFHLYGRPTKLIADTLDTRGLMFALPQEKRYGYLDLFDMTGLVNTEGSGRWSELEWRKQMKNMVSEHVSKARENGPGSRSDSRQRQRNSLPGRGSLRFADSDSMRSDPSLIKGVAFGPARTDSAPPGDGIVFGQQQYNRHNRSASENMSPPPPQQRGQYQQQNQYQPSRLSHENHTYDDYDDQQQPPPPPMHGDPARQNYYGSYQGVRDEGQQNRSSSEEEEEYSEMPQQQVVPPAPQPLMVGGPDAPVSPPPAFTHQAGSRPGTAPRAAPELRRANSRMSSTTLSQLAAASNAQGAAAAAAAAAANGQELSRDMINMNLGDRPATAADTSVQPGPQSPRPYTSDDHHASADPNSVDDSRDQVHPPHPSLPLSTPHAASPESSTSTPFQASPFPGNLHADTPATQRPSPLSQSAALIPPSLGSGSAHSHSAPNLPLSPTVPGVARPEPLPQASSSQQKPLPKSPPPPHSPTSPQSPPGAERRTNSVLRKPVPRSSVTSALASSPSAVNKSIRRKAVESAISRVQPMSDAASEFTDASSAGDYSSHYSESIKSPGASREPIMLPTGQQIPNRSEQARTGVLKVAGGTDADREVVVGDAKYKYEADPRSVKLDLPDIDFGPTQLFTPEDPKQPKPRPKSGLGPFTLSQENLLNFTAAQSEKAYERPVTAPDQTQANRRSMAWQAAAGSPRPQSRQDMGLTPEEFVQQRNSPGRVTPVYSHGRQQSMTPPRDGRNRLSKTPPVHIMQKSSGDWSAQHAAGQPGSRPHSRGATATLTQNADYSKRLSAREQEHVARMTNSPLIDLGTHQPKKQESSGGLVSAIAAREQEKQAMKAGYGGHMVQQAIAQRSQAQHQQQYAQYYDRRPSPGGGGVVGGGQVQAQTVYGGSGFVDQGYSQPLPPGYQPDYEQPQAYARQQQAYFQDGYAGDAGSYQAHSPNTTLARPVSGYNTNRLSFQPQQAFAEQRTPSPNIRGHRPNDSHDSYFRQGGSPGPGR